jgi:hypothetical protein
MLLLLLYYYIFITIIITINTIVQCYRLEPRARTPPTLEDADSQRDSFLSLPSGFESSMKCQKSPSMHVHINYHLIWL